MKKQKWHLIGYFFFYFLSLSFSLILRDSGGERALDPPVEAKEEVKRLKRKEKITPSPVKGIYVSSWVAGSKKRFKKLLELLEQTELNTLVIDIKDWTGKIAYDSQVPLADSLHTEEIRIKDLGGLLEECRSRKIYTIARIVVFQDPELAKKRPNWAVKDRRGNLWRDRKGLSWVDPACQRVWDYNISLALDAGAKGFDEIKFDYIRFPSDGNISNCTYPFFSPDSSKSSIIRAFLQEVSKVIRGSFNLPFSIDLFGLTLWAEDDLGIGQEVEDAAEFADFICPMIYPSHFARGFLGFSNPAAHPYEVIYESCLRAHLLLGLNRSKLRPWLQDFNLGARYDINKVQLEILAANKAETNGWLIWNPHNYYTEKALEKESFPAYTAQTPY